MSLAFRRRSPSIAAVATLLLIAAAPPARADFRSAVSDYAAHRYEQAAAEFRALAGLGDGASQFNLGAMYFRGEGLAQDKGVGVGWMLASAENGYPGLGAGKLEALRAKLTPAELKVAEGILAQFGHAGLVRDVLPAGPAVSNGCGDIRVPGEKTPVSRAPATDAPDGLVLLEVTVGIDGLVHDPEVVTAMPPGRFEREAVANALASRYTPGMRDGRPVPMRVRTLVTSAAAGAGTLWSSGPFANLRTRADQADPAAQFIVGMAATVDPTLKIPADDGQRMLLGAAQGGQPRAQYFVGRALVPGPGCTERSRAEPWLDQAAKRGEPAAAVALAQVLLAGATENASLARVRELLLLASTGEDPYALRHAIALAVDPRIDVPTAPALVAAAARLEQKMTGVDPQDFEAVAAIAAANGEFPRATKLQEKALARAGDIYWNTTRIEERLAHYRKRQHWSGDLLELPPRATPAPPPGGRETPACRPPGCERHATDAKR